MYCSLVSIGWQIQIQSIEEKDDLETRSVKFGSRDEFFPVMREEKEASLLG